MQDGTGGAGRLGFPTVGRRALAHRAGHTAWVTPRKKTKVGVEEKAKGTPNVPSGRRKSPAKAVLVQANIRKVPAHVRLTNDRVGLTDPGKISAEILTHPDGI